MTDRFHSQRQAVKRWRKRNPNKVSAANKRWREKYPEKALQSQLKARFKSIDASPEKYIFLSAKKRAREKGLDFNLDIEDILIPEACPLLGILLFFEPGAGYNPNAPSIDRRDNSLGYIKGNVAIISSLANSMKSNATAEQLIAFGQNIEGYLAR